MMVSQSILLIINLSKDIRTFFPSLIQRCHKIFLQQQMKLWTSGHCALSHVKGYITVFTSTLIKIPVGPSFYYISLES